MVFKDKIRNVEEILRRGPRESSNPNFVLASVVVEHNEKVFASPHMHLKFKSHDKHTYIQIDAWDYAYYIADGIPKTARTFEGEWKADVRS
eukprot:1375432-Amorphochlora_amoeboformis.AAC.1